MSGSVVIGVDTNVFVRFIVDDGTDQHQTAKRFFSERNADDPIFVSLVALVEAVWVMRRSMAFSQAEICNVLKQLLRAKEVVFEEQSYLEDLLLSSASLKADIADHLIAHVGQKRGCSRVVTFDRAAAKEISSMTLLA